jgi:hypothetical protein
MLLRERYVRWLLAVGFEKIKSRTSKYDVYTNGSIYYFVANRGYSIRTGGSDKVTESYSSYRTVTAMLKWEATQGLSQ